MVLLLPLYPKSVAHWVTKVPTLVDSTISCLSFTTGQMDLKCNLVISKSDAPEGGGEILYVHISTHKTGLHLSLQLCQDFGKNRTFSGTIGINRKRSEK